MENEDFVSKRANCIQQIQQASLTISKLEYLQKCIKLEIFKRFSDDF